MLNRMETLYLGLLRGFILVAATIALIAAAVLAVTSVGPLLTRMGVTSTDGPTASLADFVAEQKPQEQASAEDDASTPQMVVDPVIAAAAKNFHSYLGKRTKINLKLWEEGLQGAKNEMPIVAGADYAQSLLTLSKEVKASRGKPLTEKRVLALIEWHQTRFKDNYALRESEKAAADDAFKFQMAAVFGSLMVFIFIAFIFLFVRIERNLRVIRVEQA